MSAFVHRGGFEVVASRDCGLWHRGVRPGDGSVRFYRWVRFIGYVRVPRRVTPFAHVSPEGVHSGLFEGKR